MQVIDVPEQGGGHGVHRAILPSALGVHGTPRGIRSGFRRRWSPRGYGRRGGGARAQSRGAAGRPRPACQPILRYGNAGVPGGRVERPRAAGHGGTGERAGVSASIRPSKISLETSAANCSRVRKPPASRRSPKWAGTAVSNGNYLPGAPSCDRAPDRGSGWRRRSAGEPGTRPGATRSRADQSSSPSLMVTVLLPLDTTWESSGVASQMVRVLDGTSTPSSCAI